MTTGIWVCLRCGFSFEAPLGYSFTKCPKCGAEYEKIETLIGAHIFHEIHIVRLKDTNLLNTQLPIAFAVGKNKDAVKKYFNIVNKVWGYIIKMDKEIRPISFDEYLERYLFKESEDPSISNARIDKELEEIITLMDKIHEESEEVLKKLYEALKDKESEDK